jgi:hypothetical protein
MAAQAGILGRIFNGDVDGRAKPLAKVNPKTNTGPMFKNPKT